MWDLPGPGLEPVSPALAGGFLTAAPPGKPIESPRFYAKQGWLLSDLVSQRSALQEETRILKNLTGAVEFFLNLIPFLDYRRIHSRKFGEKRKKNSTYKTRHPKRSHQRAWWIKWLSTDLVLPLPSCGILGGCCVPSESHFPHLQNGYNGNSTYFTGTIKIKGGFFISFFK